MQSWQLLYNASSLQYKGLRENDVFSETEKTQLQTPLQSPAGMGTAVVGRGHGQMCYFKQNLRWGCVLSHRKSVVLVRTVNHATEEKYILQVLMISVSNIFFPPLKWLAYILVLLICNIVASAFWFCWWKAGGSPGVWAMLLSQR